MYKIKNREKYESNIYSSESEQSLKVYIDGDELDSDAIRKLSYNDGTFEDAKLSLGSAVVSSVDIDIDNDYFYDYDNPKEIYVESLFPSTNIYPNDYETYNTDILNRNIIEGYDKVKGWLRTKVFSLPDLSDDETITIKLEGINYQKDYYINVQYIGYEEGLEKGILKINGYYSEDGEKEYPTYGFKNFALRLSKIKFKMPSAVVTTDEMYDYLKSIKITIDCKKNVDKISIPIGYFYTSPNGIDTNSAEYTSLKLKDKMNDLNEAFDVSPLIKEKEAKSEKLSRKELVEAICDKYNLYLANDFLNSDKLIGNYDSSITARSWLVNVSERAGGFAKIGREKNSDGKLPLVIKSYGDVDKITIPSDTLGEYNYKEPFVIEKISYSTGVEQYYKSIPIITNDDIAKIKKIILSNLTPTQEELDKYDFTKDGIINNSDLVYANKYNAVYNNPNKTTLYLSSNNIFGCSQDEVDKIADKLLMLSVSSANFRIWGDATIDTGDLITIEGIQTICQKNWEYKNGWLGYYKTSLEKSESSLQVEKISPKVERRMVRTELDEANKSIKIIAEEKVDADEIIAQLNVAIKDGKGIIELIGDSVVIKSEYFTLDADGNIKSTSGDIGGWQIGEDELYRDIENPKNITQTDIDLILYKLQNFIPFTSDEISKYDFNNDGVINAKELSYWDYMVKLNITPEHKGKISISCKDITNNILILDGNGNTRFSIDAGGRIRCHTLGYIDGRQAESFTSKQVIDEINYVYDVRIKKYTSGIEISGIINVGNISPTSGKTIKIPLSESDVYLDENASIISSLSGGTNYWSWVVPLMHIDYDTNSLVLDIWNNSSSNAEGIKVSFIYKDI